MLTVRQRIIGLIVLAIGPLVASEISVVAAAPETQVIEANRRHLRTGSSREWSRFDETSEGNRLVVTFDAEQNADPETLLIRQSDVRLGWTVQLNGKPMGRLQRDENDLWSHWEIAPGQLESGKNEIVIEGKDGDSDDVWIGPIHRVLRPAERWLKDASIELKVIDRSSKRPIPCRLTIVDENQTLVPVWTESDDRLAVRTGVVYTAMGKVRFGVPRGSYFVYVNRGLEYGRNDIYLDVRRGQSIQRTVELDREVDTAGWVACDTHVHTVTHSGHGDATVEERMVTIAGEGIEMPIATDHNVQVDHDPMARKLGVRQYFTPVIGNEVTTKFGHFNAFPFHADAAVPDHRENDWDVLIPKIFATPDVRIVILNHGRDVHGGYRPFDPKNFNAASGKNLDGRTYRFNAMETLNSGAQQTDPLELFRDWMTLLNHGQTVTPIGSSDSHDVNRYIVGQGRTYIRCDDSAPDSIDVHQACRNAAAGQVSVSAGLFVTATVDGQFGPGETARVTAEQFSVSFEVQHPSWTMPDRIRLFQNGTLLRDQSLRDSAAKIKGQWIVPRPKHDVFLTVLATGPGTRHPSWPMAQPYQPDSIDWTATNLGFTGAIRIDVDGDGKFSSALDYAERVVTQADGDFEELLSLLMEFDEATVVQAAGLWQANHATLFDESLQKKIAQSKPHVKDGFFRYLSAWRQSQQARVGGQ